MRRAAEEAAATQAALEAAQAGAQRNWASLRGIPAFADYAKLPDEDLRSSDKSCCARLLVSMYGTRDAALNWHEEYAETGKQAGHVRSARTEFHCKPGNQAGSPLFVIVLDVINLLPSYRLLLTHTCHFRTKK